jgi:hypothetical protein
MKTQILIRWSHLALILGGLYELVAPFFLQSKGIIGWGLIVIGLAGIHARQFKKIGLLGHISFGIILISSFLPLVFGRYDARATMGINFVSIGSGALQLLGILIYSIVTLYKKALPQLVGFMMLASVVTLPIMGMGLSFWGIPIGCVLWIKKDVEEAPMASKSNQTTG